MPENGTNAVQKLNAYSHEAMIDVLIESPMITQGELARLFGYTEGWISRLLRADAFQEMLAARKAELRDPIVAQGIEKRMEALAIQSISVLEEKLQANPSADVALKALEVSSRSLGYGVAKGTNVNIQQNYVVAMPSKGLDSDSWAAEHNPRVVNG